MKIFGFYIARELPEKIIEKIVYVELGDEVDLYQAYVQGYGYMCEWFPDWHGRIFLSCHQALSECPKAMVRKVSAYKSGSKYFTRGGLTNLDVQPKPKLTT